MRILKIKWKEVFRFAINNASALDELMDLIETSKNAVADGKISN